MSKISILALKLWVKNKYTSIFSPTTLQRLFHYEGEIAVGKAAEEFNTFFGISSLATTSIEEVGNKFNCPKIFKCHS